VLLSPGNTALEPTCARSSPHISKPEQHREKRPRIEKPTVARGQVMKPSPKKKRTLPAKTRDSEKVKTQNKEGAALCSAVEKARPHSPSNLAKRTLSEDTNSKKWERVSVGERSKLWQNEAQQRGIKGNAAVEGPVCVCWRLQKQCESVLGACV